MSMKCVRGLGDSFNLPRASGLIYHAYEEDFKIDIHWNLSDMSQCRP